VLLQIQNRMTLELLSDGNGLFAYGLQDEGKSGGAGIYVRRASGARIANHLLQGPGAEREGEGRVASSEARVSFQVLWTRSRCTGVMCDVGRDSRA